MKWLRGTFAILVIAFMVSSYLQKPPLLISSLAGQVCLVTGGTRGIGQGIAIGLGEVGCTVYVTGRTKSKGDSNTAGVMGKSQVGSLEETCEAVNTAGGQCVPVQCDSGDDDALSALFERIMKEQGRLDVLVNNAFGAVSWMPKHTGKPFWEKGADAWDQVNGVGLRSHYIASFHAANAMRKRGSGLIVNLSSFGGLNYIFDVAYGIGKAAMDRMASDMAIELHTENITMVSLWPGLVQTENVKDGALSPEGKALTPRRGLRPGSPEVDMDVLLGSPLAETPLYSGRAVAALARDTSRMDMTGKVLIVAKLASLYGLLDERGLQPPPFTSIKFMLGALLGKGSIVPMEEGAAAQSAFWTSMPQLALPAWMLKGDIGAPNL